MAVGRKNAALLLYRKELLHRDAFLRFSEIEQRAGTKRFLLNLVEEEKLHAEIYRRAAECEPAGSSGVALNALLLSRRILGLGITMKIMERGERNLESRLTRELGASALPRVNEHKETVIKAGILQRNHLLSNIRDIFFGMSDGLVEVLAAVSGIGVAIQQPLIVVVAGAIVAVSGTLSMAGGAYLSTDYENVVSRSESSGYAVKSPGSSAVHVGLAYIFGSAFPLLPFILGMTGVAAVGIAVVLTAAVLAFTSVILSIAGDVPITGRLVKTLAITLGIAAITISLGLFARYYLHVTI